MKKILCALIVVAFLSNSAYAGWVTATYWSQEVKPVTINPSPFWCSQHNHWVCPSPYTQWRVEWVQRTHRIWVSEPVILPPIDIYPPYPYSTMPYFR